MTDGATARHLAGGSAVGYDEAMRNTRSSGLVVVYGEPDRKPCPHAPLEAFSDTLADDSHAEFLTGQRPWPRRGRDSSAVSLVLGSRCCGWRTEPTPSEFYDAIRAPKPTLRQECILRCWLCEAEMSDWWRAWAEQAYTKRMLARATRSASTPIWDRIRILNTWAENWELVPRESFPDDWRMT